MAGNHCKSHRVMIPGEMQGRLWVYRISGPSSPSDPGHLTAEIKSSLHLTLLSSLSICPDSLSTSTSSALLCLLEILCRIQRQLAWDILLPPVYRALLNSWVLTHRKPWNPKRTQRMGHNFSMKWWLMAFILGFTLQISKRILNLLAASPR